MNLSTHMAVFKLSVLALLLICCLHSIKAMGLCDFADKFPCEDNEGSVCFKNPGCKGRKPRQGQTTQHNTQRTTQQKQVTTEHATSEVSTRPKTTDNLITSQLTTQQKQVTTEHATSEVSARPKITDNLITSRQKQVTTEHATSEVSTRPTTTDNLITTQLTTQQKQVTTEHATSEVSTRPKTSDSLITTTPLCPPNMVYGNCSTCQRTCSDPKGCITNCTEPEICICADGFLLKEGDCVPEKECGCFIEGEGILHEGGSYLNVDCTGRAECHNGQLIWDNSYRCTDNAVCEERNNVRKCYTDDVDCLDVYNDGFTSSDVYTIKPTNWPGAAFPVYCNMSDGGGWTVFQHREDGLVEFYQNWTSYKEGFGFPDHEHWLGNDKLYYLTNQKRYTIRIDFVNLDGSPYYAKYDYFRINDESDNYRLSQVGSYSGTAGYAYPLTNHRNYQFSTYDQDHDTSSGNCAVYNHGAWWYYNCHKSNLNGRYDTSSCSYDDIYWYSLPGSNCNRFVEMKVRPF